MPSSADYQEAISALRACLLQLTPDGKPCGLCAGTDHYAGECLRNPLYTRLAIAAWLRERADAVQRAAMCSCIDGDFDDARRCSETSATYRRLADDIQREDWRGHL